VDPSGGSSDSFTLGIAGTGANGVQVLMCIREWVPPFSPAAVVGEIVDVLRTYRLGEVTGDNFSGEFVRELFRQRGVRYQPSPKNRSGLYIDGLALINSKRCRLLDHPKMRHQLLGLERRVGRTSDVIDHRVGAHDDVANAAIGSLTLGMSTARTIIVRDRYTGQVLDGIDPHTGCEFRDGKPWNGVFRPERDAKDRPLGYPARFVDGHFVGDVI
jgi:hypothetical protein